MPDYIIRQRDRGQAEAKCLRPRPKWPRGLNVTVLGHSQNAETTKQVLSNGDF